MRHLYYILLGFIFLNACTTPTAPSLNPMEQFDTYFSDYPFVDTLQPALVDWNYDDSTMIIPDSIFYSVVDTSTMTNKNWDERQLALYKWKLSDKYTAYVIARHFVNHDQSILMLLYDQSLNRMVADFPITEFMGYEGFIYSRKGWIFKNEQDKLIRVAKDKVWTVKMPEAIQTDSSANHLFIWDKDKYWQTPDSAIIANFDFSKFVSEE